MAAIVEGPTTRTELKNRIEAILTNASFTCCEYLCAMGNNKRTEAARCWDEVQGVVEYELPIGLLRPINGMKSRRSRERVVRDVMQFVAAEVADHRHRVEVG